jgi:hypothetical protein
MDAMMDAVENGEDRQPFPMPQGRPKFENKGNGGQGTGLHDDMVDAVKR